MPYLPEPGELIEIRVDGAIEYRLRLIPSNKVIGRFASTLDAWPAIIAAVDAGRAPRTLALDSVHAGGRTWLFGAGQDLVASARINNGEPHPYPGGVKRVAEA